MELSVLDREYNHLGLVERFNTFIWREKWNGYGDFEITIPYSSRRSLGVGNYLYMDDSRTLMVIERFERLDDWVIKVSGRSIVSLLKDKVDPGYVTTRRVSTIPAEMVRRVCIDGEGVSTRDIIPNLRVAGPPAFGDEIRYEPGPVELYDAIKKLSDEHDFGFVIDFHLETKQLTFRAIQGEDRRNSVAFSTELGNLKGMRYLTTQEEYKNVAYVLHDSRSTPHIVYRIGHETARGLDRRVLLVDASNLRDPTPGELRRAGQVALNKQGFIAVLDGELDTDTLLYNRDYRLGDLVMLEEVEANRFDQARVAEYIWSYDSEGLRKFPTIQSLERAFVGD